MLAFVPPLCWGTGFTIAKPAVDHFPPLFMMFLIYGAIVMVLLFTVKAPIRTRRENTEYTVHAEFAAEMVRQALAEHYPEDVYTRGFRVYTTIRKADQDAAYDALRKGVLEYDRRAGYRGPEGYVELPASLDDDDIEDALADHPDNDDLEAAVVLAYDGKQLQAALRSGERIALQGQGLQFAARALDPKAPPQRRIRKGAIIRVQREGKNWQVVQLPEAEAAIIALDPQDGAIRALVGGFDFWRNKFNHVTQAWRQPGSSFKPFIYSAALEKGFTPATIVQDEPIVVEAEVTGSQRWEPKNYDGKFEGPMRLRVALSKSKNLVTIRVLQAIGPQYAQDYIARFGFLDGRAGYHLAWLMASYEYMISLMYHDKLLSSAQRGGSAQPSRREESTVSAAPAARG